MPTCWSCCMISASYQAAIGSRCAGEDCLVQSNDLCDVADTAMGLHSCAALLLVLALKLL